MPQSCPSCRAPIAPTDAFCPNCGRTLHASSQQTVALPAPRLRPEPTRARRPAPQVHSYPAADPQPRQARRDTRPWHTRKRIVIPLAMLVIILAAGGTVAWIVNDRLAAFNTITSPPPDSIPGQVLSTVNDGRGAEWGLAAPSNTGGTTMLLMGVDAREGETVDFGVRPDSLSVLHLDGGTCRTLSIPRDTRTILPGYGYSKINHALSVGGIEYQTLVVEQLLGIEIDHFALIDFDGMAGIVDAIGGVTVTTPNELSYEGVTVPAGTSTINGDQALVFARFRDDPEGDFGRQRRQQELIKAIMRQANPTDAPRLIPSMLNNLEGHLKTDLRAGDITSMGLGVLRGCAAGEIENAGLDGAVGNDWDEMSGQELSFVHVSDTELSAKVNWLLNTSAATAPHPLAIIPNDRHRPLWRTR